MSNLYEKLTAYSESDAYGFHMPGHKRNGRLQKKLGQNLPFSIDITEITDFDDLHHAKGILLEGETLAASLYGSEETHFLVNGSTVGILSAILGSTKKGDKVLVARNCHKSVYHALELNELSPIYVYPQYETDGGLGGEISPKDVECALENHPDLQAVILVSPTYDGIVSDLASIARLVHARKIPLIIDEAHGAHFGFHPYFPKRALDQGADVVINSLHKTLPSLTQTALIHMKGPYADKKRIRKYLHMLQSSSPSYVLMASMDACVRFLINEGEKVFSEYADLLKNTREALEKLKHLRLIEAEHFDPSKLVISVDQADISSHELSRRLWEDYHLEMEMTAGHYVLAMTSVGDDAQGMKRLVDALFAIDDSIKSADSNETDMHAMGQNTTESERNTTGVQVTDTKIVQKNTTAQYKEKIKLLPRAESCFAPYQAVELFGTPRSWQQAVGLISLEYAYLYPPGCPLLVPGERVSQETADMLQWYQREGFEIEGLEKEGFVTVWEEVEE